MRLFDCGISGNVADKYSVSKVFNSRPIPEGSSSMVSFFQKNQLIGFQNGDAYLYLYKEIYKRRAHLQKNKILGKCRCRQLGKCPTCMKKKLKQEKLY